MVISLNWEQMMELHSLIAITLKSIEDGEAHLLNRHHNYLKCIQNRKNETQVFLNACVSFDYNEKFVEIIYSNLASTSVGVETDIDNLENFHKQHKNF